MNAFYSFMVYVATLTVAQIVLRRNVGLLVHNELVSVWNDTLVAWLVQSRGG
jgi:hypothetical protein